MTVCVEMDQGGVVVASTADPCPLVLLTADEYAALGSDTALFQPDWDDAVWFLGSILLMWATGIAVGVVIQVVRKLR